MKTKATNHPLCGDVIVNQGTDLSDDINSLVVWLECVIQDYRDNDKDLGHCLISLRDEWSETIHNDSEDIDTQENLSEIMDDLLSLACDCVQPFGLCVAYHPDDPGTIMCQSLEWFD